MFVGDPFASIQEILREQDAWGFGQVVAVFLLLLPFLSFSEAVYGK